MSRIVDAAGPGSRCATLVAQRFEPGESVFARAVRPVDATDAEPALAI